ncbi:MAG: hypothetical protein LJE69_18775 [Thiohalocapsa sp.]|uniref:hypothetical protein n=1 Tax=Thiohalocapsa sp. TaxID=2497641 RepID=UPI0025FB1289|nr:hypothetical protein [Thiohalocapsa sp.]MCG6943281.1 hypothetical protein [Thiohalocapsa sp.]
MTQYQDKAVWELCRQGFHGVAADAEAAWSKGEDFRLGEPLPLARELLELIRIANWETQRQAA